MIVDNSVIGVDDEISYVMIFGYLTLFLDDIVMICHNNMLEMCWF